MPIAASNPAACVSGMPWSPHAGTRCVPIKPFVLAPQMKNDPASSQNVRVREAPPQHTEMLRASGLRLCAGAGSMTSPPQGGMPTSTGRSRNKNHAKGISASATDRQNDCGIAPAAVIDQHAEHRQEDELAGRISGTEDADHEAALGYEPTIGNRSANRKRKATDADAGAAGPEQAAARQQSIRVSASIAAASSAIATTAVLRTP